MIFRNLLNSSEMGRIHLYHVYDINNVANYQKTLVNTQQLVCDRNTPHSSSNPLSSLQQRRNSFSLKQMGSGSLSTPDLFQSHRFSPSPGVSVWFESQAALQLLAKFSALKRHREKRGEKCVIAQKKKYSLLTFDLKNKKD